MEIKQANWAKTTGKRGLPQEVLQAVASFAMPLAAITSVVEFMVFPPMVDLKPGEENEIVIDLDRDRLPVNAEVKAVTATLHADKPGALTGAEQAVVSVRDLGDSANPSPNAPERSFALKLDAPGGPRNVELRLGDGASIWSHAGTLEAGVHALPDFAVQMNAVIDALPPGGNSTPLPFRVKSDTPGKIGIQITRIEYRILHTQSWVNEMDDTVRLDRNLQLDYGTHAIIPLDPPAGLPSRMSLVNVRMDVAGELGPERLLGSVPVHDGREFALISSEFSIAQRFSLEQPAQASGLAGFLLAEAEAELYAEIKPGGADGPAGGQALVSSNLALPPAEAGTPSWTFFQFQPAVELKAGQPYWIVVKGIRGRVRLGLRVRQDEPFGEILVNRGGQLWRRVGLAGQGPLMFPLPPAVLGGLAEGPMPQPVTDIFRSNGIAISAAALEHTRAGWQAVDQENGRVYRIAITPPGAEVQEVTLTGLLRLVYLPEVDNQTAAVDIALGGQTDFQKIDPVPGGGSLQLAVGSNQGQQELYLDVRSHARGTFSLANLIQEYGQG